MGDASAYRDQSLRSWQQAAAGWEREGGLLERAAAALTGWLVEQAGARPGATLLELACGPGAVGLRAAALLQPGGRLIATDQAPAMVEVVARRAAEAGLEGVEARVMDAEQIDLPDDAVDGVLCRFGLMLMADPARCLREVDRVLRPDGHLAAAVWGSAADNPWPRILGEPLVEHGLLPPGESGGPGIFALGDPERIAELFRDAGLERPRIEPFPVTMRYADADEYWRVHTSLSTSATRALEQAAPDAVAAVRAEVERQLDAHRAGDGIELTGLAYGIAHPAR